MQWQHWSDVTIGNSQIILPDLSRSAEVEILGEFVAGGKGSDRKFRPEMIGDTDIVARIGDNGTLKHGRLVLRRPSWHFVPDD